MSVHVAIRRLLHGAELALPAYATPGAAGMDLAAALSEDLPLAPAARVLIPTGFAIALPAGYEAQIRPRSGLAARHGITVLNSPGTIDADYRGEIHVLLINCGQETFTLRRGMRIAQMIIAPVASVVWRETTGLDATFRAAGGFGSTGLET